MSKKIFPTAEWLEMLEETWRQFAIKCEGGPRLSLSETYTNVPEELAGNDRGVVAWTCVLDAPDVHFSRQAGADADLRVEADYEFVKDIVKFVVTPENKEAYGKMIEQGYADGKISMVGDPSAFAFAGDLHNEVARQTA